MAQRDDRKRLGKKHRQASTRPKQGRAPRTTPTTGAVDPRKRKSLSTKRAEQDKKKRTPTRSPERESRHTSSLSKLPPPARLQLPTSATYNLQRPRPRIPRRDPCLARRRNPRRPALARRRLGRLPRAPTHRHLRPPQRRQVDALQSPHRFAPLHRRRRARHHPRPHLRPHRVAVRRPPAWSTPAASSPTTPNSSPPKSSSRPAPPSPKPPSSSWSSTAAPSSPRPDIALARLLLRGGKPVFLAVNKIDTIALAPAAENFRRLGFRNVLAISAEHGAGIGDLLDAVFAALPAPVHHASQVRVPHPSAHSPMGGIFPRPPSLRLPVTKKPPAPLFHLQLTTHNLQPTLPAVSAPTAHSSSTRPRSPSSAVPTSANPRLLNALTGSARAIVSPIAGTTRDAVDEVVTRGSHDFRFVDTAGIRRKGKTRLMAEKLSVIMARKHLEAADVSLLVLDATEGVSALDANIGGYAHESGRSVIIVVNKWDLVTTRKPSTDNVQHTTYNPLPADPRPLRAAGPRPPQVPRLRPTRLRLRHHRRAASRRSSRKSNSSPASAASASPPAR